MESQSRAHRPRSSDPANSPEFEFWNLGRYPSPPTLHSADEIFSDGFLLPLHLLPDHHNPDHDPDPDPDPATEPNPEPGPSSDSDKAAPSASIISSAGNPILTASKRWKEIFKRGEKKPITESSLEEKPKKSSEKRRQKKNENGHGNVNNGSSAELNINIWPFSRSRSAGNNPSRSRPVVSTGRKVSSAPCSRSNSSGESKTRRSLPSSPGRAGVHLGRTSPVWKMRRSRAGSHESRPGKAAGDGVVGKGRVLNLNVPMCIGYRQHLNCRSNENGAVSSGDGGSCGGGGARSDGGNSGSNGNLFSLRGLFSKKGVLTV